jgi:hypothetical protein
MHVTTQVSQERGVLPGATANLKYGFEMLIGKRLYHYLVIEIARQIPI